jgi:hypothetical protein
MRAASFHYTIRLNALFKTAHCNCGLRSDVGVRDAGERSKRAASSDEAACDARNAGSCASCYAQDTFVWKEKLSCGSYLSRLRSRSLPRLTRKTTALPGIAIHGVPARVGAIAAIIRSSSALNRPAESRPAILIPSSLSAAGLGPKVGSISPRPTGAAGTRLAAPPKICTVALIAQCLRLSRRIKT